MEVPEGLFYTKEHEWARIEGNTAYVGITDYAQSSLGDITFIELPKKGEIVEQFKHCVTVESIKAASEVYAPLSGKVVGVNEELASHPELINQSPYEKGYFFIIEISDGKEKANLMDCPTYTRYVQGISK